MNIPGQITLISQPEQEPPVAGPSSELVLPQVSSVQFAQTRLGKAFGTRPPTGVSQVFRQYWSCVRLPSTCVFLFSFSYPYPHPQGPCATCPCLLGILQINLLLCPVGNTRNLGQPPNLSLQVVRHSYYIVASWTAYQRGAPLLRRRHLQASSDMGVSPFLGWF